MGDQSEKVEEKLFSLSRTEYRRYLVEGTIDPKLQEAFEDEDYDIEDEAELSEEDGGWFISNNGKKEYIIKKESAEKLNVYTEIEAVREYGEKELEYINEENLIEDKGYFEKGGKRELHPSQSKVKFKKRKKDFATFKNSSYYGHLKLPSGKQIPLEAKTSTVPIKLLNYSSGVECNDSKKLLYYDIDKTPEVRKGPSFFSFLAEAYLNELKNIIEKGFVREYVKKEENLNYLKGKLKVSKHIKNNFAEPKFYCRYFDLTIDNFCNQMVLYAGYKLEKLLQSSSEVDRLQNVRSEITSHVENLKNMITLRSVIHPEEANNIFITRKNDYYETILDISKMVINEAYYQSEGMKSTSAYNHLIDMNVIFERTVFKMFSEVLENFSYNGSGLKLEDQQKFLDTEESIVDLPGKDSLNIIPDITLFDEENDKPIAVIETKYKGRIFNSDYYQVLTYSLFLKRLNDGFDTAILVHFKKDTDRFEINRGKINLESFDIEIGENEGGLSDIELYRISMNIGEEERGELDIEKDLEDKLKEKIENGDGLWRELKDSLDVEFNP